MLNTHTHIQFVEYITISIIPLTDYVRYRLLFNTNTRCVQNTPYKVFLASLTHPARVSFAQRITHPKVSPA